MRLRRNDQQPTGPSTPIAISRLPNLSKTGGHRSAVEWYRRAAEQGHAWGQKNLGHCYLDGIGVARDSVLARKWLEKAAGQGLEPAQLTLSIACEDGRICKDPAESLRWLREAANGGSPSGQLTLAYRYATGDRVARDLAEAAKWCRLAAESGYAAAQCEYGRVLYNGGGVAKNPAEAVQWFRKAAEQGDADGQLCLGCCYADGTGTPKDFELARRWFRLATEQGSPEARYRLRLLFFEQHSLLGWLSALTSILGYTLLTFYGFRAPFSMNVAAIGMFIATIAIAGIVFIELVEAMKLAGFKGFDEKEANYQNELLFSAIKRKPWRLLLIPAEDGFFLVPLLYIGISPASAFLAGLLFAVMHYPAFPWRYCVPKGVAYFFVALFILPYGIWSVIAGHLVVDVSIFVMIFLGKVGAKPTWRRLVQAIRTA